MWLLKCVTASPPLLMQWRSTLLKPVSALATAEQTGAEATERGDKSCNQVSVDLLFSGTDLGQTYCGQPSQVKSMCGKLVLQVLNVCLVSDHQHLNSCVFKVKSSMEAFHRQMKLCWTKLTLLNSEIEDACQRLHNNYQEDLTSVEMTEWNLWEEENPHHSIYSQKKNFF